jgi:predicted XRE-type DNA-binding protein
MYRSSGNVFRDLGIPPREAENLRVRAELMVWILRTIERRKLTRAAAAKLLHVSQPRIRDLMSGKIDLFSVDALMEMLWRAGIGVSIQMKPRAA